MPLLKCLNFLLVFTIFVTGATSFAHASSCSKAHFEREPVGSLSMFYREDNGSNGGGWYKDQTGRNWYVKRDANPNYTHLQTSAEVIGSEIYRFFGYKTPKTYKIEIGGFVHSASLDVGETKNYTDFSLYDSSEVRQLRVVAAFLKDWDRFKNPKNNLVLKDGQLALIDFGGALGSKASGKHKQGIPFSDAVGVFENTHSIAEIYQSFRVNASPYHPWQKINLSDLEQIVEKFRRLSDQEIVRIVKSAKYELPSDEQYMISALISRRDAI